MLGRPLGYVDSAFDDGSFSRADLLCPTRTRGLSAFAGTMLPSAKQTACLLSRCPFRNLKYVGGRAAPVEKEHFPYGSAVAAGSQKGQEF